MEFTHRGIRADTCVREARDLGQENPGLFAAIGSPPAQPPAVSCIVGA